MEVSLELSEGKEFKDRRGLKAGDVDISKFPTIAEVIAGKAPSRQSDDEITIFMNNLGLGYQFTAAGAVVCRKAKGLGVGHDLAIDWFTELERP